MRAPFTPPTATQFGGAFPVYRGVPYQRGAGLGSVFKNVLRFLLPIGKTIGKEALRTGLGVASDALDGQDLVMATKKRGRKAAKKAVKKVVRKLQKDSRF